MTTLVDAPTRVDGVQLIGEMVGSGYRTPPALVRRKDGQVLQLTPLLYLVLNAADGRRSCAEIAELLGRGLGRSVSDSDVRSLVNGHLRPLGLLKCADGSDPELKQSNPLLALKPKVAVTNPRVTRWLTDPFRVLFHPVVAVTVVVAFALVVAWVFFERGLGASAYDAFERPHLLLLVFVVSVLAGGFHEFGHAAAARYGGAQPGTMGAGLYLVWPAFYTDVTDSYRLGRAGRIRTDLGGLYFNAIVAVATFVWWWATGWDALLLLVATQVLQMAQQLLPLLRFDGYHLLADLSGVPDLYQRIRPTLLGLLPHRWKAPENRVLTPWARVVITVWVLVTIPMMALMLAALVIAVPRVVGSAGAAVRENSAAVADAWGAGSGLDVSANTLQLFGLVLPIVAGTMVLSRVGLRFFGGLATWSRGSLTKRLVATVVSAVVFTLLIWVWWPHPGAYRPIEPGERGTLTALLPGESRAEVRSSSWTAAAAPSPESLSQERLSKTGPVVTAFQRGSELPTKADPTLAMVLVPAGDGGHGERVQEPGDDGSELGEHPEQPWVFPFDRPLPAGGGDNQAIAVASTDGSMSYDIAFALVWADGDEVLNVNEAHAYASCSDCVAVAVAFQVVLVMEDARVVAPQNLAVAANYDCYRCITAAIASQLVLSLDGQPDQSQLRSLAEVWDRVSAFAREITSYSVAQINARLEGFKSEMSTILRAAPVVPSEASGSAGPSPSSKGGTEPTETAETPTPSPSPSQTSALPTPQPTESATPGPDPSSSPTSESSTGTSSGPEPGASTTPSSTSSSPSPESTPTAEPTTSP